MASFITAGNATNGLQVSSDNTGILELRTGTGSGTTAVTFSTGQRATFPSTISVGNTTPATTGAGITFPAAQSASSDANTLDDYEEGTWTPTITAASGTYTTVTASGSYIKVGNAVTVRIRVDIANNGTAATRMNIANFPFAAANTQSMSGATREDQNTGNGFVASSTGTNSITVNRYDATYGLATGAGFTLCITYITS